MISIIDKKRFYFRQSIDIIIRNKPYTILSISRLELFEKFLITIPINCING